MVEDFFHLTDCQIYHIEKVLHVINVEQNVEKSVIWRNVPHDRFLHMCMLSWFELYIYIGVYSEQLLHVSHRQRSSLASKNNSNSNKRLFVHKTWVQYSLQVRDCRCSVSFGFGLIHLEYFSISDIVRVLWWVKRGNESSLLSLLVFKDKRPVEFKAACDLSCYILSLINKHYVHITPLHNHISLSQLTLFFG